MAFTAAFAMAMGPIGWLFCAEIFPNKVRGRAMSVASFTVWVSCYIVAQTFPMLNDSPRIGPAITFWIYGAVSLLAFLIVLMHGPGDQGAIARGDRGVLEADVLDSHDRGECAGKRRPLSMRTALEARVLY